MSDGKLGAPKAVTVEEQREANFEACVLTMEAFWRGSSKALTSDFEKRMAWDVLTCKLFPGERFGGYLKPKGGRK